MSIDERGRRAGASLRTRFDDIQVDRDLDDLFVSVRRRRNLRTAVAVAATVVVVIGGLSVQRAVNRADVPPTSNNLLNTTPVGQCELPFLRCQAGARFTVRMQTTMTWTLSARFDPLLSYLTSENADQASMIETHTTRGGRVTAGVTVAQPAFAARLGGLSAGSAYIKGLRYAGPDDTVGPQAHAIAEWLSTRPFLIASDVTRSSVDGRLAWTVEVRLRDPQRQGRGLCGVYQRCTPILSIPTSSGNRTLGIWDRMVSRYTFVDLDQSSSATAIWSFSFDGEKPLATNQALIDTIHFDGG